MLSRDATCLGFVPLGDTLGDEENSCPWRDRH